MQLNLSLCKTLQFWRNQASNLWSPCRGNERGCNQFHFVSFCSFLVEFVDRLGPARRPQRPRGRAPAERLRERLKTDPQSTTALCFSGTVLFSNTLGCYFNCRLTLLHTALSFADVYSTFAEVFIGGSDLNDVHKMFRSDFSFPLAFIDVSRNLSVQ